MYHVSTQGVDEHMINVQYYYYCNCFQAVLPDHPLCNFQPQVHPAVAGSKLRWPVGSEVSDKSGCRHQAPGLTGQQHGHAVCSPVPHQRLGVSD